MNKMKYSRLLSSNERLYIISNQISPPFSIQLIVEGQGEIDKEKLKLAIMKASEANPGSRLKLKGHLGFSRWIDSGQVPPLREIIDNKWDGMSPIEMPSILKPLDFRNSPTCEVIIVKGNPMRYVFRCLHAVMDGSGLLHWTQDIFRVLRGEEPIGSDNKITDYQLLKSFNARIKRPALPQDCSPPTGTLTGSEKNHEWIRRKLNGIFPGIVAQVAVIIAQEVRKNYKNSNVRFMISTDLRLISNNIQSTGNLSNPIYLEIPKNSEWKKIYNKMIRDFMQKKQLNYGTFDFLIRYIPLCVLKILMKFVIWTQRKFNKYNLTGIISHNGKFVEKLCSGGGFNADSTFHIPSNLPVVPTFVGITEVNENTEIVISMAKTLSSEGRLENLITVIENHLTKSL